MDCSQIDGSSRGTASPEPAYTELLRTRYLRIFTILEPHRSPSLGVDQPEELILQATDGASIFREIFSRCFVEQISSDFLRKSVSKAPTIVVELGSVMLAI